MQLTSRERWQGLARSEQHRMMMRVHPWSLACIALLLLLGLTLGFTGNAAQLARIAAGIALLLGSGLLLRFVGHDRIGGTLECWATFFLFGLFGMFASVVLASTRLPYTDALLVKADALLGFHWLDAWRYFDDRPQLFLWTRRVYDTIHWQPFLGIALMFATGQGRRAVAFLIAWISSLLLTLAIFPFFPAVAANAWFHVGTQVALPGRLSWLEILHLSRTGALRVIDSRSIVGLITFPSFHASAAVLLAWLFWGNRVLRWPFLLLNIGMGLSAIVVGGHYLIDIIGGAAVAGIGIWLAARLQPRHPA